MTLRTRVIVNPASAGGATGRTWTTLRRGLDEVLDRWEEAFTLRTGHATDLARQAVLEGFEQVVVVGGDGTLNEVVNGLFPEDAESGIGTTVLNPDLILAPVRKGTGGDFARLLALPGGGSRIFAHIGTERRRRMDLGLSTFRTKGGSIRRRAFANIASFGLTGLVDQKVNASGKLWGSLSFMGATISAMLEYRRVPVRVQVDDEALYEGKVVLGAVANGRYFGGGVQIAPSAEIDDGQFDIVVLTEAGLREVSRAHQVYSGRHRRWPSVRIRRGRVVKAERLDDGPCLIDLDGEQPGVLDASFELVAEAVRLSVP